MHLTIRERIILLTSVIHRCSVFMFMLFFKTRDVTFLVPPLSRNSAILQGTTQAFAGLTLDANRVVSDKVSLFVALAPVVYLEHTTSALVKATYLTS